MPLSGLPILAATAVLSVVYFKQLHMGNPWIALYATGLLLPVLCAYGRFFTIHFSIFALVSAALFTALGYIAATTSGTLQMWLSIPVFYLLALATATQQEKPTTGKPMAVWVALLVAQGLILMTVGNIQVFERNGFALSWSMAFYAAAALSLACALLPYIGKAIPETRPHPQPLPKGGESTPPKPLPPPLGRGWGWVLGLMLIVPTLFLIDMPHNGGLGLSPQEYAFAMGAVGVAGLAIGFHRPRPLSSIPRVFKLRRLHTTILAAIIATSVYVVLSRWLPKNYLLVLSLIFISQTAIGYILSACRHTGMGKWDGGAFVLSLAVSGQLQFELGYRRYFLFCLAAVLVAAFVLLVIAHRRKA